MILAVRTAEPKAELTLFDSEGSELVRDHWEAGRQLSSELLAHIKQLLASQQAGWAELTGLVVFRGPGSFTGLRIGITVANTIAYARKLPIVGELDSNWLTTGLKRLQEGQTDTQVVPEYGAPPRITKPKT